MFHADFRVVQVDGDRVFIVDLDSGNRSVTNDAEWVWEQVNNRHPGKRLIYRDTMNRWDEIVGGFDDFNSVAVQFRPYDEYVPF